MITIQNDFTWLQGGGEEEEEAWAAAAGFIFGDERTALMDCGVQCCIKAFGKSITI